MVDIEKLKALALAATTGPWDFDTAETPFKIAGGEVVGGDALPYGDVYTVAEFETPDGSESLVIASEIGVENGRYIAAANPAAVLDLIAEVERLRAATQPAPIPARNEQQRDECNSALRAEPAGQHNALPVGLSPERIAELYRQSFNAMVGRLREAPKHVPDTVLDFARAIEAEVIAQPKISSGVSGEVPHDVWQERVACARIADSFAETELPGERRYSGNVISARILARSCNEGKPDVAGTTLTDEAKDAARYRWLRNQESWGSAIYEALGYGDSEDFDKALDAAMHTASTEGSMGKGGVR